MEKLGQADCPDGEDDSWNATSELFRESDLREGRRRDTYAFHNCNESMLAKFKGKVSKREDD